MNLLLIASRDLFDSIQVVTDDSSRGDQRRGQEKASRWEEKGSGNRGRRRRKGGRRRSLLGSLRAASLRRRRYHGCRSELMGFLVDGRFSEMLDVGTEGRERERRRTKTRTHELTRYRSSSPTTLYLTKFFLRAKSAPAIPTADHRATMLSSARSFSSFEHDRRTTFRTTLIASSVQS